MRSENAFPGSFLVLLALIGMSDACGDAPYIDPADDEAHFGDLENVLFWDTPQKVAGFRNMKTLAWTRQVDAGTDPYPLPEKNADLSDFSFVYEGTVFTIDDYIRSHNVAGLLLIKDGFMVYERYELGNSAESLWMSWSVAKSVTSLLVGAAIQDGYIKNVDEKVSDYLPRLQNSSYDDVTIRNLMQMSSGVQWDEDYADPESDINTITWDTLSIYEQLRDKPRIAAPGEVFNYNTAEINLVGTLLRSAVGNNLSTYLSEKIWQPFGMERDALWNLSEPGGGEFGGSSLNATLRDYGRIGLFALKEGRLRDGTKVLPEGWMAESATPSQGLERYGYLWWLRGEGTYAASGIFGQAINIDPVNNIVIAQHSAREAASLPNDWALQRAFFKAITAQLRR
jgi:CubicO group peptidase (beta-lactamase class C family)